MSNREDARRLVDAVNSGTLTAAQRDEAIKLLLLAFLGEDA